MKTARVKTIKSQIFSGYVTITLMIVAFVLFSIFSLANIRYGYRAVSSNRSHQTATQAAVAGHYDWLESLSESLQTGQAFGGSLDYSNCSLGKWMASISQKDLADSRIRSTLSAIETPHEQIHTAAGGILEQAKSDPAAASARYTDEIKPQVAQIIDGLQTISGRYGELADQASNKLELLIVFSTVAAILLAGVAVAFSLLFAKRLAHRISKPITAVAEWSKRLSLGAEDLDFDESLREHQVAREIDVMIESFEEMVKSIQENVQVVKRVADGDMTAYVNIRSQHDTLGKNLYRMVQSNDLLFAEIVQIARQVAQSSGQISESSHSLAQTASVQAAAIHDLSNTVDMASRLISESAEKTVEATHISEGMENDMRESSEKMGRLMVAVEAIREASEKISAVIKSIDDIAFQTNILSLNASVEAARAGEAGKGFAVVADEVRELALKSAQAAQETKMLIENTIEKTHEGSAISHETSETFDKTINDINRIIGIVVEIDEASSQQLEGIQNVRDEISRITAASSGYAAVSEESAAASQEMRRDAELLREAMSKFNLRKRRQGQAYIPPEKQNDAEFIRIANENYQKALAEGKVGRIELAQSLAD